MHYVRLSTLITLLLVGCAPTVVVPPEKTDELLSGRLLFGEELETDSLDASAVLAITDEMREYVRRTVRNHPQARGRLNRLVSGMINDGLLTMDYDANQTYTAAETFRRREGNCLSFSILFAALAREANLQPTFQMVDIPPTFRSDGEVIMLDNHINVRIFGLRKDMLYSRDYVVDFNNAEFKGNYRTKKVKDTYAIALYFSNIAVDRIRENDWRGAFQYLKKAIETDAAIPGIWVNLGVIYSRNGLYEQSVQAYQQALSIQPSNRSALVNLTTVLNQMGRQEEADYYSKRVSYYRNRHPYYHYSLAQAAFEEGRMDDSLLHIAKAIKLKDDEHQFYYLMGLVHQSRHAFDEAARNYEKAKEIARDPRLVAGYSRKLDELEAGTN